MVGEVAVSVTDPEGRTGSVDPQSVPRPSAAPQNADRVSADPQADAKRRSDSTDQKASLAKLDQKASVAKLDQKWSVAKLDQKGSATKLDQNPERVSADPLANAKRRTPDQGMDVLDPLRAAGGDRGEEEGEDDEADEEEELGRPLSPTADPGLGGPPLVDQKGVVGYKIRPDLDNKFRPGFVQALMEKIIRNYLDGQPYDPEETPKLSKQISDEIQQQVVAQKYSRYKLVSYVVLGERRGEGVSASTRCIWDADSDCIATYTFLNETIFCCATVYGIYYY